MATETRYVFPDEKELRLQWRDEVGKIEPHLAEKTTRTVVERLAGKTTADIASIALDVWHDYCEYCQNGGMTPMHIQMLNLLLKDRAIEGMQNALMRIAKKV